MNTPEKKLGLLEQAFMRSAGSYYSFNLTRDLVPETIYETVDHQQYAVNERIGLPVPTRFTDVIAYWGNCLPKAEQEEYFLFFDRDRLLRQYRNGKRHFSDTYWSKNVLGDQILAEQHIVLYDDEESGDVLGFTYIFDQTKQAKSFQTIGTERQLLDVLCRDYTTVYFADLNEDIAEPLKVAVNANTSQISRIRLRKRIGYTASVEDYCGKYVIPANQKEFLKVMERNFLRNALEKSDRFIFRYESTPNLAGHRYFEAEVVRLHAEEFDGRVIVAFRHIDDFVMREQAYQEKLEKTAYCDALTGIGNRAAFREELELCGKYSNAACVVADVNNLKLCNDRYGHQEGDRLIRDAAASLCQAFQGMGKCFRIGGDEFCVLLTCGDFDQIQAALERMHAWIQQSNSHRTMPLSIATGYAIRENVAESMEHLFNRGDEMMYDVKYRMKKAFPVYCEERIKNYLNVLSILSRSTDSYLFLWNIGKDETWFFGDIDLHYAIREPGKPTNSIAEMVNIIYPIDRAALQEDLQKVAAGKKAFHDMNYRWVNRQGEAVWISCRGAVLPDDKGNPFVMIGRVSDTALQYLYHPLTKLFNKNKMMQDLKDKFFPKSTGFWMLIGIDNLSGINLRHGRLYGDAVLKRCGDVMERYVSPPNIWHVENNCFALYLDVKTQEEVQAAYDQLQAELSDVCTLSAGVVPNQAKLFGDERTLYDCAEMTFEKAKNNGMRSLVFFSQKDLEQRVETVQFLEELQESVKNGCDGFYLCYQPLVKGGNYQLYAAEALLRYRSPKRGVVYPDELIPLLERSKLIGQVGMWVLETALRQCKRWRETLKNFRISVNFSAVQLNEEHLAECVLDTLNRVGLPGSALTVEITESVQLEGIQRFRELFKCWREAGVEISIDDFGTGYASMGYLKELDISEIKIDRIFVKGVEEATYNYRLISNMIEFAKSNAIRICCEGVENLRELAVLEGLAPNLIQGYLFAKPCEKETFEYTFINQTTEAYQAHTKFIQKLYQYKDQMNVMCFDIKDILRKTDLGLWTIRIHQETGYHEMHADETMERVLAVDQKYTPQECYDFWYSRIPDSYREYVEKSVHRMMETDKVVQLQYPWKHPVFGEVVVRCSGRRVEDTDGMVTLVGYHRIISDIEETSKGM